MSAVDGRPTPGRALLDSDTSPNLLCKLPNWSVTDTSVSFTRRRNTIAHTLRNSPSVPQKLTSACGGSASSRGHFPHWKLKTGGVIMPDERLSWVQTIVSGLQHGVAMAGGTIIAPLIMGFDPNLALFFSGVGTLIFFLVVGGRVPAISDRVSHS